MKIKVVNVKKFVRSILIIIGIVLCLGIFIGHKSLSFGETKYKTIYVSSGDTLWSIAKDEKETNEYYVEKDIRDIVDSIKFVNNLNGSNLNVDQKLVVPVLGQI